MSHELEQSLVEHQHLNAHLNQMRDRLKAMLQMADLVTMNCVEHRELLELVREPLEELRTAIRETLRKLEGAR